MTDYLILITTHNRPRLLKKTLRRLKSECKGKSFKVKVKVYNDGSTRPYIAAYRYLGWAFKDFEYRELRHHGKEKYYVVHQIMYEELRKESFKYLIQIPDDMLPIEGFFEKATQRLIESEGDLLNLIIKPSLSENWTKRNRPHMIKNGLKYWKMPWFECFITTKKFCELMEYTCPKPRKHIRCDPTRSSGVGAAMSLQFYNQGGHTRVVDNSLLTHEGRQSVMRNDKPIRELKM